MMLPWRRLLVSILFAFEPDAPKFDVFNDAFDPAVFNSAKRDRFMISVALAVLGHRQPDQDKAARTACGFGRRRL
jgi:hypothetical protein